jgi:hypothetical protein
VKRAKGSGQEPVTGGDGFVYESGLVVQILGAQLAIRRYRTATPLANRVKC